MVLKSVRMGLRTTEVPVTFYKDRNGRQSHHKRSGGSPLPGRVDSICAPCSSTVQSFSLFKPGIVAFRPWPAAHAALSFGGITIVVTFNLYWMLIG